MLLRDADRTRNAVGVAILLAVGVIAAILVIAGNPGNMGLCGACFLRDTAGALGLISKPDQRIEPKLSYFRPEIAGILLGALAFALARRTFAARSGSHAASRFALSVWMAIGALVFLGCPFRMLQRLGGGDLNALAGLGGFVAGVFLALRFERRGYGIGRTATAPAPTGLHAHALLLAAGAVFVAGGVLVGPAAGFGGAPPHAPWLVALGLAALAGALLSTTGFCAVSAARQIFAARRPMLLAAAAFLVGYGATLLVAGRFRGGFDAQPVAHTDAFWNFASMLLVGLTGALAGGCPVRQLVMAGEGNGDAFMAVAGLTLGGAIAHNLGLASAATGPTAAGKIAVVAGIAYAAAHAFWVTRGSDIAARS